MKLKQPFVKLPLRFSAERLAAEVRALPPSAWTPHPQGFVGNEAVPLVSPNGEMTNAFDGSVICIAEPHIPSCRKLFFNGKTVVL